MDTITLEELIEKCQQLKTTSEFERQTHHRIYIEFIKPFLHALSWEIPPFPPLEKGGRGDLSLLEVGHFLQLTLKPNVLTLFILGGDFDRRYETTVRTARLETGISAVTNFDKLIVHFRDNSGVKEIENFSSAGYLSNLDALQRLFSKESIESGDYLHYITDKLKADFDTEFSDLLLSFRKEIAEGIWAEASNRAMLKEAYRDNLEIELNRLVQTILDRFLIYRFAEDKMLLPQSRSIKQQQIEYESGILPSIWKGVLYNFDLFRGRYNGKIFDEGMADRITLQNNFLINFVKKLYDVGFSEHRIEVLGHIYEKYLGEKVYIEGDKIRLDKTPEARKAGGVYYTPSYITKYIVDNTLGVMLGELEDRLEELEESGDVDALTEILAQATDIKILDPACGSGAFLIQALKLLRDFYETYSEVATEIRKEQATDSLIDSGVLTNKIDPIVYGNSTKSVRLSKAPGYYALQYNLYGVDIDERAVEVTAVSLMMQILDEVKDAPGLKFPAIMEENIKCGNSLISGVTDRDELEEDFKDEIGELIALRKQHKSETDSEKKIWISHTLFNKKRVINLKLNSKLSEYFDDVNAKKLFNWEIEFPEVFFEIAPEQESGSTRLLPSEWSPSRPVSSREGTAVFPILASQPDDEIAGGRFSGLRGRHPNDNFTRARLQAKSSTRCVLKENPGFDCVVGNPPYQRIQGLRELDAEQVEFFNQYFQAATKNYDIYALFGERGLNLAKIEGTVGYIQPHKFIQADFGSGLRKLIAETRSLNKIVNFKHNMIFEDATTYTCMLFLKKSDVPIWRYAEIPSLKNVAEEMPAALAELAQTQSFSELPKNNISENSWTLGEVAETQLLEKLKASRRTIGNVVDRIFVGLQTSADKIYFLEKRGEPKEGMVQVYSQALEREIVLETGLLKPLLKGKDVKRYTPPKAELYVIFPYNLSDERPRLFTADDIQQRFPKTWDYLLANEKELRGREHGRFNCDEWWQFSRPQNLEFFEEVKLMTPDICQTNQFTFDKDRLYQTTTLYGFVFKEDVPESPEFFLILLNSRLLWFFLSKTGTLLRGGFLRCMPRYLRPFPLPKAIDFTNTAEKSQHDELAALADKMLHLNKRLHNELKQLTFLQICDEINPNLLPLKEMRDRFRIAITGSKRKKLTPKVIESFEVRDGELRLKDGKLTARVQGDETVVSLLRTYLARIDNETLDTLNAEYPKLDDKIRNLPVPDLTIEEMLQALSRWEGIENEKESLAEEIQDTDNLIDAKVFRLYGLERDEIIMVLDSLGVEDEMKVDILEKWEQKK